MPNITLKNAADADVVFSPRGVNNGISTFISSGANLMDSKQLTFQLRKGSLTNRVVAKLSVPTVQTNPSTGLPSVAYTEVGSFDLTAVKVASSGAAEDFVAMFASLAGNTAVEDAFLTGTLPV